MSNPEAINVAVNGFGRIGMVATRLGIDDPEINLLAINTGRGSSENSAAVFLEFDTVHRDFGNHVVTPGNGFIMVDEEKVAVHGFRRLEEARWKELGEKLVILESTGAHLSRSAVEGHLEAGADRVVITAPAKDLSIPTIVRGVNDTQEHIASIEDVVAVSSCSTNCIAPILKVIDERFGINSGSAHIVHAYTSSQKPLDGIGDKTASRRGLASILPAKTGSATEVERLLPQLEGKFKAKSWRVNNPNGSLSSLTLDLKGNYTRDDIIEFFEEVTSTTHKDVIGLSNHGMFAERVLGDTHSSVIDKKDITVQNLKNVTRLYLDAWFDNEFGYANRVVDVAKLVGRNI